MKIVEFEDTLVIPKHLMVTWVSLDEGMNGDYNEDDPNDVELLRFDVHFWDEYEQEWYDPGDASYCTLFPVKTSQRQRRKALRMIADAIADNLDGYKSVLQRMSWISPDWLKEKV